MIEAKCDEFFKLFEVIDDDRNELVRDMCVETPQNVFTVKYKMVAVDDEVVCLPHEVRPEHL